MPASDELLDDLAGAVLDGEAVDWSTAESSAEPDARPLLPHLRLISSIAQLHREVLPIPPAAQQEGFPDRWAHLRLLEHVGSGAFGQVFRAWDTRLDREVALKLLPAAPLAEGDAHSIIQEGRLLAKVRHPNVVTIHGAEQIGDRIGLWMEFVRGETLEQLLRRGTVFTEANVIQIGLELSRAVSAVHAAGLLHRDIKAHNVTRAEDGRVVLMDFGTGKELDDNSSPDLAGTPLYLAPEVLAGGPATIRSDIYSLGVLLYHLGSGSYPIWRRTVRDVRRAHERNERVSLRTARPDLSSSLARVIERACDPQAERRYAQVEALARDLAALQRRQRFAPLRYGVAATTAVLLVALAALEYRARASGDTRSLPSRLISWIAGAPSPIQSPVIVVLPFKNSSSEPGSSRLVVDSLAAGLIQELGLIQGLKVVRQHSSFALRDKPVDLASLGKQLRVTLVVEGDVQFSSGTLVAQVRLRPVTGGDPLWRDTLTRDVRSAGDLTGVLTEIARKIVNELRLTLGPTQRQYSTDLVTYETYLRARELRDMRLGKGRAAIPLFEEVILRDPSFAPAQAALAATYGDLTMSWPNPEGYAMAPAEAMARMASLTEKALELDPMLAEAHVAKAYMHALARRWIDAEASFRHAIRLDPTVTAVYGDFVLSTLEPWGRLDEALALLQAALELDPLSLDLRNVLSRIELSADRFDDALANCQRVMAEDPGFPFAAEYCARALVFKGRTDEALELFNRRRSLNEHGIAYVYAITGRRAEAQALAAQNAHLPNRVALIYAALGDKDRAFEALERLAVVNPRRAGAYLNYPELAALRGDPRVDAFRRTLGFPLR